MEVRREWTKPDLDIVERIDRGGASVVDANGYPESIRRIIATARDMYSFVYGDDYTIQHLFDFDSDAIAADDYDLVVDSIVSSRANLFITYWDNGDELNMDKTCSQKSPRRDSSTDYDYAEAILVFRRNPRAEILSETPLRLSLIHCLYTEIKSKASIVKTYSCSEFSPLCLYTTETNVAALIEITRCLKNLRFTTMDISISTKTMFMTSASSNIEILAFN